ncbi:hypothetical protein CRUP_033945 [Coryphaenoides rupestris]|nr:hypothetical protein CRUP_033945 [Coryphaenoides rupestris]
MLLLETSSCWLCQPKGGFRPSPSLEEEEEEESYPASPPRRWARGLRTSWLRSEECAREPLR